MKVKPLMVVAALAASVACQTNTEERPTGSTAGNPMTLGIPIGVQNPGGAEPTATPAPSPTPSATPTSTPTPNPLIHKVRVGFFGIGCKNGKPLPRNGERKLPLGCRGYVTASPKDADGHDVHQRDHGPDIEWFLLTGDDFVDVDSPTFPSDFNKDLIGRRVGPFILCATVQGVTGCLSGDVIH